MSIARRDMRNAKVLTDLNLFALSEGQARARFFSCVPRGLSVGQERLLLTRLRSGDRKLQTVSPSSLFASCVRFVIKVLTDLENESQTVSIDM